MTTLREAAQQALEALENVRRHDKENLYGLDDDITALRSALAEPVQEPVAWRFEARHIDSAWAAAVTLKHPGPEGVYMRNVTPLYTAPPQRKPLTEEEMRECFTSTNTCEPLDEGWQGLERFARAIERAHGIGEHDE